MVLHIIIMLRRTQKATGVLLISIVVLVKFKSENKTILLYIIFIVNNNLHYDLDFDNIRNYINTSAFLLEFSL